MILLVCLLKDLYSVTGFQPVRFSLHMAGSCQNQCVGWKGSLAALLNHGVPSTSQNSCRVGAGSLQTGVHWSVYIRSLSVYQSDITPVSCTIDFTVFCSKKMWGKWTCVQQTTAEHWIFLSLNGWIYYPQDERRIGAQSIALEIMQSWRFYSINGNYCSADVWWSW